ncbi:MAG: restriction endonuclease subunit S, partial [bacterium]
IWTQLGCVIDYNYGGKTESERIPADAWLLDLEDIEKDTSRLLQRVLAGDRKSTSTKSHFSAGDVLYGKLRPYLNKVLVANSDGYCTTEIVPMKPHKGVNPYYVVCVLKSRDFLDYTAARSYGMKMPRLGTEDAKRAPFPLPPLLEQKRIVTKVNELMKRCDELESRQEDRAARHKTLVASCLNAVTDPKKPDSNFIIHNSSFNLLFTSPESVAELRKTILQLAVQGRLVPQDPRDECAQRIIEKTMLVRGRLIREGQMIKCRPPEPVGDDGGLFPLPGMWAWTRLTSVANVVDPNPSHRMPRYVADGIPFISSENFSIDDKIDFSVGKKVMESTLKEQRDRFQIGEGAFALSRIGTIGKTRPLLSEQNYAISHALVVISSLSEDVFTTYLRLAVTTGSIIDQAHASTKSIGVPDLGMGHIRNLLIPLPPLAEQKRIVAKVAELMAMCEELEAGLTQSRAEADTLAAALVRVIGRGSQNGK